MARAKFVMDATVKSAILKKIATEISKTGTGVALDSYYKDPNGGGGGLYGKGDDPVFGKSDPQRMVDFTIDVASRTSALAGATKVAERLKKYRG